MFSVFQVAVAPQPGTEGLKLRTVIGYNGNGRGNMVWSPDQGYHNTLKMKKTKTKTFRCTLDTIYVHICIYIMCIHMYSYIYVYMYTTHTNTHAIEQPF